MALRTATTAEIQHELLQRALANRAVEILRLEEALAALRAKQARGHAENMRLLQVIARERSVASSASVPSVSSQSLRS